MQADETEWIVKRLAALRQQHRDLDTAITTLLASTPVNELQLTRLKKHKLQLKDAMTRLESRLIPDLDA